MVIGTRARHIGLPRPSTGTTKAPVTAWHKHLSCISLCYQADFTQILRFNIRWWLVVATVDAGCHHHWRLTPHCMVYVDTRLEVNWQTCVLGCIIQSMHSISIMQNYYFTYGFPYFSFPAFSSPAFSCLAFSASPARDLQDLCKSCGISTFSCKFCRSCDEGLKPGSRIHSVFSERHVRTLTYTLIQGVQLCYTLNYTSVCSSHSGT